MDQAYSLIEQLNWFLKPVSKTVMYLFTTTEGQVVLAVLFFLFFVASFGSALWKRKMLHLAARSSYERGRVPGAEKITLFVSHTSKVLFQLIMKFPVLLAALLLIVFINGVTDSVTSMHNYVENQKEISKLKTTIKHLDKSYKVAEMEVVNVDFSDRTNIRTKLKISYFDYADMGLRSETQEITLSGRDIYVDAYVMNFEYSEIAGGDVKNLAIPYRIFSNKVPQAQGIKLELFDDEGVPFVYHRNQELLYGINKDEFDQYLQKITTFIDDREKARESGIRSIYGNAVHRRVLTGQTYEIRVEQSGGIVLNRI